MNIYVAYSGGTDSTYTLLYYKEQGHTVTAVHAQFAPAQYNTKERVALLEEFCMKHDIAFRYLDYTKEFHAEVIEEFCSMYGAGKTPNPCALCNPKMKFGRLRSYAFENGADIFATGHYTQCRKENGKNILYPAVDNTKDQSYFLSLVPEALFTNVEFPLGLRIKEELRSELKHKGITPPFPSDSQEICFIPEDDYRTFLEDSSVELSKGGAVCLISGAIVGKHNGLWQYTEGQRRGLAIAYEYPLYVIRKDIENNILYVGSKEEAYSYSCLAKDINIFIPESEWIAPLFVRMRYRQKKVEATVRIENGCLHVTYMEPQEIIAQGQVLAVYNAHGAIVAGGILDNSLDT